MGVESMGRYLGDLILSRKEELGLSFQQIADALGYSKSYAERIAKGRRIAALPKERRTGLAAILKVGVGQIDEALRRDAEIGEDYDVNVRRSAGKSTAIARIDELPDDDLRIEMINRMLDVAVSDARRRNAK